MLNSTSSRPSLWIPVALGTALFLALGGLTILSPSSLGWLMRGLLDPPTYQLGWEFFRHTPWAQFPLGANPDYGMALGSSIVFSDSLPLFALPFKLLSPWLPETFQYFGLWILTCFVLQAVFAYLLIAHFTSNRWLLILGTSLLLLMPAYLMRMTIHMVLAGQWLLLAGFYLYFAERFRDRFWVGLLLVATLTHAYLLVMLGAIWAADLLQRLLKREHGLGRCLVGLSGGIVSVILVMWLLGYFMLGPSPVAPQGYLRMNLLALFDSRGDWSRLLPAPQVDFWDSDGFAYMGAGMLGLLFLAIGLVWRKTGQTIPRSMLWPLMLMSLSLLLIALTNTIKLGPYTLLQFDLPASITNIYQIFRSPGRLFWPAYYLLNIIAIVVVCLRLKANTAIVVLALTLGVQLYDLSRMLPRIHSYFTQESSWQSPLTAPMWEELGERYRKVLYVMPHNSAPHFILLADFANRHRMAVNIGNFARVDLNKEKSHQEEILAEIGSGQLDPQAIYVFMNNEIWEQAQSNMGPDDQAGMLDDLRLVLPNLRKCPDCKRQGFLGRTWGNWPASQLPSLVGELRDDRLVARPGVPGYLSYGPYTQIPAGQVEYAIVYASTAGPAVEVGAWDIVSSATEAPEMLASGRLTGTAGQERTLRGSMNLEYAKQQSEIRTLSTGEHDLQLIRVELKLAPSTHQ
jgi:hypothetical protein